MPKAPTPPEVLELCNHDLNFDQPQRFRHRYSSDGTICSIGKNKAGSIVRMPDGWKWICFRCMEFNYVKFADNNSPKEMVSLLKQKRDFKKISHYRALPSDCISVLNWHVPSHCRKWMHENGIGKQGIAFKYGIKYSMLYDRLIFPIFNFADDCYNKDELLGWQGRSTRNMTPDMRAHEACPKWITSKITQEDRMIYKLPSMCNTEWVVMVEDIPSAIHVHEVADGIRTIALLNSEVTNDLMEPFKDKKIILWLDKDKRTYSVKKIKKYIGLGYKVYMHLSEKDPKKLTSHQIREILDNFLILYGGQPYDKETLIG